jgi:hypothetical protein
MTKKLSDITIGEAPFKCLFTGAPGTRKTTAACSFRGRPYLMDIDKKAHAMALPASMKLVNPALEYDSFSNWTKIDAKLESLQRNCPYDVVIFDSITVAGDIIYRMASASKGNPKKIGGIPVATIEDYKAETSGLLNALILGLALPCSFIMIAHVLGEYDGERTIVTGAKKLSAKIPAYFAEVFHFNANRPIAVGGSSEYEVVTQNNGLDFARTALPLPATFEWTDKPFFDVLESKLPAGIKIGGLIETEPNSMAI